MVNKKTRFATEGFRARRLNPDGTRATKERFLGFSGTCDLSGVLTASKADMTIKVDGVSQTDVEVDFTAALDETAVTVAEAITALTGVFTDPAITFSADATTGRLLGTVAAGTVIQVTGPLAAAMDFGQGIEQGGNGLEFIKFFADRTMSIGLPKNIKAKEEIDLEGAKGTLTRMVIAAKNMGLSPVVAVKDKDYEFLELVQGGTYDRTLGTYDPPLSTRQKAPLFEMEIFSALYGSGTNKMEDIDGYEKLLLRSCIGMEGDVPIEAKSWAKYAFNIEATETDASGTLLPAMQESTLTVSDFDALDVENV